MNTTTLKLSEIKRNWHLIDLSGKTLGRVSTQIAVLLIGKNKASYSPNMDDGDFVVVINAADIVVTGKKLAEKKYYRHSGFPGGLREESLGDLMKRDPRKVIERAVKGMLPKNKLQDVRLGRLKVYKDEKHPYTQALGLLNKVNK